MRSFPASPLFSLTRVLIFFIAPGAVLSASDCLAEVREGLIPGTNIEQGLAASMESSDLVTVIVTLKNQPVYRAAREIQEARMPRVREKNLAVRGILAKYAGNRAFNTAEEVRAQAKREATAVTSADRARIKDLNREADRLLDEMRLAIHTRAKSEAAGDQTQVCSAISALGGTVLYVYTIQSGVAARIPGNRIPDLAKNPLIARIAPDVVGEVSLDVSGWTLGTQMFWDVGENGGIWDAAICDSGVDKLHPALQDDTEGAREWHGAVFHAAAQTSPEYDDNPYITDDLQGHGSHVAGIVLSSDPTYRGVACGADTGMILKSLARMADGSGKHALSDDRAALDWASGQPEGPEVINLSLGWGSGDEDHAIAQFMDAYAEAMSCTMACAAGNYGPDAETVGTMSIGYNVICVANVNDLNTSDPQDDVIAGSSSRGPTVGGRRKPDIAAPGTGIVSCNNEWEGAADDFVGKSGTSMASPQVAGATLLLNDVGIVDPREVKAVLINTATDLGDAGWDPDYGWGYMNLRRAYLCRADVLLDSVTPYPASGWYRLYKTTGMDAGEKATLVWYRHAVYDGANTPSVVYALNDLDIALYDESDGTTVDWDASVIDNVHQVTSDRSGTQVIKIMAAESAFSHGSSTETYALAAQAGTAFAVDPTVTPSAASYSPPLYAKFTVSVQVSNTGDLPAHDCAVTLTLPSGVIPGGGPLTQNVGIVPAGGTKYADFRLDTTSAGAKTVQINTSSLSYGLQFEGSASFTVTPGPADAADPYSILKISEPSYQTGGTDKIANGGFEPPLTGWVTSGAAELDLESPHGGRTHLTLGPGDGSAYQTVAIDAAASYATLTFWYRSIASTTVPAGCIIKSSGGLTLVYALESKRTESKWEKVTADVSRFKGQTVRIYFYSLGNLFGDSTLWVDDVSLKQDETIWIDDVSQLTILARDSSSGIDYSEYHVGADPWTMYSTPFTLAGKPDGDNYVCYRSADNGGNIEPIITARVILDARPPRSILRAHQPSLVSGGTEKASNGGFESGLSDWWASGAAAVSTSSPHSGSKCLMLGGTGEASARQDVPVSASSARAYLSFWTRSLFGSGTTLTKLSIIDPESGLSCFYETSNSTRGWENSAFDVSGFKGSAVRVEFSVEVSSGAAATLFVDDVTVLEDGEMTILPGGGLSVHSAELLGVQTCEYKVDGAGFVEGSSFTLTDPGAHSVSYRATDYLGQLEPDVDTQVTVDNSGPTGSILINGGAAYVTSTNVALTLSAFDLAGVDQMRIRDDSGTWGAWQAYVTSTAGVLATPGDGTKTFSVQYMDTLGHEGEVYSDSIEYRVPVDTSIHQAKVLPNGSGVRLTGNILTAGFPSRDCLYIEEVNRCSGIRVSWTPIPSDVNIYVDVEGVTGTTADGEREIIGMSLQSTGPAPAVRPLGMPHKSVGGGNFGTPPAGQIGSPGVSGLNNVGLLVRMTGEVTDFSGHSGPFCIADGSSIVDNPSGQPSVYVEELPSRYCPPIGSYVSVSGISGVSTFNENPMRVIRPRDDSDIVIAGLRVAYIYKELAEASSFKDWLDSQWLPTTLVPLSEVTTTDLTPYQVILIGADTKHWSNEDEVNAVLDPKKPIVAIGGGGANFLDAVEHPDLYLGKTNSVLVPDQMNARAVGGDIYSYPYVVNAKPLNLYVSPGTMMESLNDPTGVTTRMLRQENDSDHFPLASEYERFYQWGFYGAPDTMTDTGRQLFVNLVFSTAR